MSPALNRTPLYRTAQLRELERTAHGGEPLMERAGLALALLARDMSQGPGGVLILAGPGNNGGDGWVAARHLRAWGIGVEVVHAGETSSVPTDAGAAMRHWLAAGGAFLRDWPAQSHPPALIVDALFGIGLDRPPAEPYARWIELANARGAPILAVDVPSGLNADTGRAHAPTIRATRTLTFLAMKPGLFTLDGPDHCGTIQLSDLGLRPPPTEGCLLRADELRLPPPRARNTHKGHFGSVGVLGGAPGTAGAAILAARAVLYAGAGLVHCALLDERRPAFDPMQPELMLDSPEQLAARALDVVVIGPGMGMSGMARDLLAHWLAQPVAMVLDADALNLVAAHQALSDLLARRTRPSLLTPHPAEAARLLGSDTATVQADRIAAARALAARLHAHVVLKGVGSVIADTEGHYEINTSGNPGMSGPGQGDVLAGLLGALLAQGLDAGNALRSGVLLHGLAADRAVRRGIGPAGLTASECLAEIRALVNGVQTGQGDSTAT